MVKVENIPCKTSKRGDSGFLPSKDTFLICIDQEVSACILARYFKGIESNNSNAVIVRITEDEE